MSSLLLINGSPRGPRSNSMKMLARIAEGWQGAGGGMTEVLHLAHRDGFDRAVELFPNSKALMLGMPLYTDSMPSLVNAYIEAIASHVVVAGSGDKNPILAFLVQSGFPEALHSRPLERYLAKLAHRLGSPYAGTIVRGAGESLQSRPDWTNRKLWAQLRILGGQLARDGHFGSIELHAIAGLERFQPWRARCLTTLFRFSIVQFYWNRPLKKNGAWSRRFAAPYGAAAPP